jgi:hypothetical protein
LYAIGRFILIESSALKLKRKRKILEIAISRHFLTDFRKDGEAKKVYKG